MSKYNLEERTIKFSQEVISMCKNVNQDLISRPIIAQLIRSATSIGANYMEANNACSKKDFRNKIFICKKESQETKYWLIILKGIANEKTLLIDKLKQEVQKLTMIFQKITNTLRKKV